MSGIRRSQKSVIGLILLLLIVLAACVAYFWVSLTIILDPRRVASHSLPSESMAPTLLPGDYFNALLFDPTKATRGTPIVYNRDDGHRVSRIAGLPGDTIELRGGIVYVNGRPAPQRRVGSGPKLEESGPGALLIERLPGEIGAHRIIDRGPTDQDDFLSTRVPPGNFFLLSDNRDNAADSRFPYPEGAGMVPFGRVEGQVGPLYWAKDRSRIGKPLDLSAGEGGR